MINQSQPRAPWDFEWRSTDFPSVAELQYWLEEHGLAESHPEPNPEALAQYDHPGYEAFQCRFCGRASMKAVGNQEVYDCGRNSCR